MLDETKNDPINQFNSRPNYANSVSVGIWNQSRKTR